jgi:hypothetical protein
VSCSNAVIGTVWAFVYGLIAEAFFGWLSNKLVGATEGGPFRASEWCPAQQISMNRGPGEGGWEFKIRNSKFRIHGVVLQ